MILAIFSPGSWQAKALMYLPAPMPLRAYRQFKANGRMWCYPISVCQTETDSSFFATFERSDRKTAARFR
jgi:hypothetical protein